MHVPETHKNAKERSDTSPKAQFPCWMGSRLEMSKLGHFLSVTGFLLAFTSAIKPERIDKDRLKSRWRRISGDDDDYSESKYTRMIGKWPWAVRLVFEGDPHRRCGGTLISRNVVLTAAHCVSDYKPHEIGIHVGDVHTLIQDPGEQIFGVKEKISHPYYHERSANLLFCGGSGRSMNVRICVNDVALLVLDRQVGCNHMILLPWSSSTVAVLSRRFPNPVKLTQWKNCHVAGWGYTSPFALRPTDMLRDANVSIVDTGQCNSTCSYGGSLLQGMLCATGDHELGQDACFGDSGGPLMCQRDNTWHLVGVVSWGFGCGDPFKPGVYADVGYYQEWILREMKSRPRIEVDFWNSLQACKSSSIRIRECWDPWDWQVLRRAGIHCSFPR